MSGTIAASSRSTIVTNVAMIRMYAEIRTSPGMRRLSEETSRLEPSSTKNVATPIAMLLATVLVTASVGHSPSICTSTGFSRHTPRIRSCDGVVPRLPCAGGVMPGAVVALPAASAASMGATAITAAPGAVRSVAALMGRLPRAMRRASARAGPAPG